MNNFVTYKTRVLAKNSDAFSMLVAANKLQGKDRDAALKKLDQHLKDVDRCYEELTK